MTDIAEPHLSMSCKINFHHNQSINSWIIDIGTTYHMVNSLSSVTNISPLQCKYVLEMPSGARLLGWRPAKSPMDQNLRLDKATGEPLSNPTSYRRLIGRLNYLTNTRPDISFVIHNLTQFMAQPRKPHTKAATEVLRYIRATLGEGFFSIKWLF